MKRHDDERFYMTTAIAYTSGKPHIGNTYEAILADSIARFRRMQGYDVFFQTGTDEHGQKIEDRAGAAGKTPKQYVDEISGTVREVWDCMNVSYDKFIRTTDPDHMERVQKIFKKMHAKGDIYKDYYEGMYCKECEAFYTPSQIEDGKCPDCGSEVHPAKEEAYFFRMSKYADRLIEHINTHPEFIQPVSRKNEMMNNFLLPGLQDLCVSRTSFKWGIPVDFDDKHVVYVWIDALSNYITSIGYDPDGSSEMYKKFWPADAHIIGKDIVRFHTIYWPIMLMALGEPLPKQVFGHPWLLFGEDKMSKSRGNVIYADELVQMIGVDAVRYYLLSEMPFANDGSITYDTIVERFNSDLANTLGNLVNRTIAMNNKYFGGVIQEPNAPEELDDELKKFCLDTVKKVDDAINVFHISDAVEAVINLAKRCNKDIDDTAPWVLAKNEEDKPRLGTVLYNLLESIRFIAVLLEPFMPDTNKAIFDQINCDTRDYNSLSAFGATKAGVQLGKAEPLFVRIDPKKFEEEISAKQKAAAESEKAFEEIDEAPEDLESIPKIGIDDFAKCDIRVGEVKACEKVKKSKKLLQFTIFDGTGERTIVSGIAKYYAPEELVGKKILFVSNLKPVKLCGVESRGMILSAVTGEGDNEQLKLIMVDDSLPAGWKIS